MRMDLPPEYQPPEPNWTGLDWLLSAILAGIILVGILSAFPARADSAVPAPRLARALSAERAAAQAERHRHNATLRDLWRAVGVPSGSGPEAVQARADALAAVVSAISNRVEIMHTGVTADSVAAAVAILVAQETAPTNQPSQKGTAP